MEPNKLSCVKSLHKRKWLGMTLVEVLIASAVFAISFGSLLVAQQMGRTRTEHALINFVALHYAQGLLEAIQSYDYEEPLHFTSASAAFNEHPTTLGAYQTGANKSGVYLDDNTTYSSSLSETSLGLRYYRTTLPASPTALNPFTDPFPTLSYLDTLMGPDLSDKHSLSDTTGGIYRITQTQRSLNVFASMQTGGSVSGQERTFFFDDVDDFDGYREVRTILSGISVTFDVSVMAIYGNSTNFSFSFTNSGGTTTNASITQLPFNPMMAISMASIQAAAPSLLTASNVTTATQAAGYSYYQSAIFKKITIRATWVFPIGSNNTHTIIIDGGKVNPNATQV